MMNKQGSLWRRVALSLSSLLFVGLVSACNPIVPAPAPAQAATKPAAPAAGLADVPKADLDVMAAFNSTDVATELAAFADNAVVKTPVGLWVGKPQIAEWLKETPSSPVPAGYQVNGDTVIVTGTTSLARFKQMGVDPVAFRSEFMFEAGKIKFFSVKVALTPAQQEKVKQASPPAAPAATVPQAYIDTIVVATADNFAAALASFTDNAVVKTPVGLWVGKPQIAEWLKGSTGSPPTPAGYQLNGDTVIVTGTVSLERFRQMGIDPVAFRTEVIFEAGKIKFFAPAVLLTPAQRAKVAAASAPAKKP